jgi:hypothetical protein
VTVLIGTNDARTGFPETAERFFQQSLSALMSCLRSQTIARIALLSIPPLGTVITAEINRGVDRCNAVIRERRRLSALGESLRSLIERSQARPLLPFKLRAGLLLDAAVQRYILRGNWNVIVARRGFAIHTDQIHLNDPRG